MKRLLLIATVAITSVTFSQKGTTSSAGLAFKNYWQLKLTGGDAEEQAKELVDAKEFIDQAKVHEDTKNDPKTLMYYGKIYIEIPFCAMMSGDEVLSAVDGEKAVKDGFEAFKESKKYDTKERYVEDINGYCSFYRSQLNTMGSKAYDDKEWATAAGALLGAGMFGEAMGLSDSLFFFYGGLAAYSADSLKMAEEAFSKTTEWGYQPSTSVYYYSQTLQKQNKIEEAEKMVKAQAKRYPGNKDILIEMVNIYIDTDRKEDAVVALNEAIELDPNNVALVFTAGTIYENMEDFENAEKQYNKALELDPKDVNSLSALGGLYFNKGADVNNAANKLEFGDPNYDAMVAESKDYFKKAVPFLEKATEAKPEELTYWIALRDAYGKAGDVEKFKEAKAKVAEMQGK